MSFEHNHCSMGLLRKNDQPSLINNQSLAFIRLYLLERKFKREPSLATKYKKKTINEYINKGHTKKLTEKESKTLTIITNYIPHHRVTCNVNKPGKVRVVYDAAAELNNISLNKNLLKGPNLFNQPSWYFTTFP